MTTEKKKDKDQWYELFPLIWDVPPWVNSVPILGLNRLIIFAMVKYIDEKGEGYPTWKTLRQNCGGIKKSTMDEAIKDLKRSGILRTSSRGFWPDTKKKKADLKSLNLALLAEKQRGWPDEQVWLRLLGGLRDVELWIALDPLGTARADVNEEALKRICPVALSFNREPAGQDKVILSFGLMNWKRDHKKIPKEWLEVEEEEEES